MTYVVAGVTGNTGSVVASTLLEAKQPVRVVVRSANKGEPWRASGAEVAVCDFSDHAALAGALEGADGAYLLLPPVHSEHVVDDLRRVTEHMARAIELGRPKHVVFLSSIGAHLNAGTGPIATVRYAESRLREIHGTHFTFLRPPYFMENFAAALRGIEHGTFQSFIDPEVRFATIATADIGKVAARCLLEGHTHDVVELAGPSEVTVSEVAETFGRLLGKSLRLEVSEVSAMADVFASIGLARDLGRLYAEMIGTLNKGALTHEGGHAFERGATTVETVARKLLGGARS
jgi:uncharacterized protein YbjT (DUF2867 family)